MALLEISQILKDTYEVEKFLGEGAFAEVYRVRHRFLGRQAMKVFKQTGMTLDDIERMLEEAILLSRIGHPNIVRVFDANVLDLPLGQCGYFTMENVPGGSLDRYWHSHGQSLVPIHTTIGLMKQVCRGLSLAHSEKPPIIHRDIKPQNILVGYEADGLRARISDFGLAKTVNPLTLLATAAGTLAFKPPEVFMNPKADSCASDVWALGTTLYLLLTDKLPFDVDPDFGWGKNQVQEAPRAPSESNIQVNKELDEIILKCLEPNPTDRFQDAQELLLALEAWKPERKSRPGRINSPLSQASKAVLGLPVEQNSKEAQKIVEQAVHKARKEGRLLEAADLMEEAFNQSPSLREKYESQVRLWRCGISM